MYTMSAVCSQLFTYFSLTINNPDENDYLIVRNPNEKYVRQVVWTNEVGGKENTPHLQLYLRLYRNNSLALVKKLYPRAHIKGISRDEYNENCHAYAQKDDETTRGSHVITANGVPVDASSLALEVVKETYRLSYRDCDFVFSLTDTPDIKKDKGRWTENVKYVEDDMVFSKPHLARIVASASYKSVMERFVSVFWDLARNEFAHRPTTNKQTNNASDVPASECPDISIPTYAYSSEEVPSPAASEEEDCSPSSPSGSCPGSPCSTDTDV